ncbi:hypothetical protein [Telmatospirillum siberiense]|nr:hypothetical protein [Telmatospirillum siberiense]
MIIGVMSDMFGGTNQGILVLVTFLVISAALTATLPNTTIATDKS